MNKLVSIIIPVYNVEKYLNKCIVSVVSQSYKNLEVILIDDGSLDTSSQICDEWAKKDGRIKVIHQKNRGVSSARNAGLNIASGTYVGFVDSDDWIEQNTFEKLVELMEPRSMVVFNVCFETNSSSVNKFNFEHTVINNKTEIICKIINGDFGWTACWDKFYDLTLIRENHLKFDESLTVGEDYFFIYQYAKLIDKVILTNDVFYHYYLERSDSVMNSHNLDYYNRWLVTEKILYDNQDKQVQTTVVNRVVHELYDVVVELITMQHRSLQLYRLAILKYKKYFKVYFRKTHQVVSKKMWLLFISPFIFKIYIKLKEKLG